MLVQPPKVDSSSHCASLPFVAQAATLRQQRKIITENSLRSVALIQAFFPGSDYDPAVSRALERLAEELQKGRGLGKTFRLLEASAQNLFRKQLGPYLEELVALSQTPNREDYWQQALQFGIRLKREGRLEVAGAVFKFLSKEKASPEIRNSAASESRVLRGEGSSGQHTEFWFENLARKAFDLGTIVPMVAGSAAGLTVGTAFLGRLAGWTRSPLTRGWGARISTAAVAGLAETSIFATGLSWSRGDHQVRVEDFLLAGLTVSTLRLSTFLGNQAFLRIHRFNEWNVPARLTGWAGFSRYALPQASLFAGLLGAHYLESKVADLPSNAGLATTITDVLGSMVSLQVGSTLGRWMLGSRFAAFREEVGRRADIFTKFGDTYGGNAIRNTQEVSRGNRRFFQESLARYSDPSQRTALEPAWDGQFYRILEMGRKGAISPLEAQDRLLETLRGDYLEKVRASGAEVQPLALAEFASDLAARGFSVPAWLRDYLAEEPVRGEEAVYQVSFTEAQSDAHPHLTLPFFEGITNRIGDAMGFDWGSLSEGWRFRILPSHLSRVAAEKLYGPRLVATQMTASRSSPEEVLRLREMDAWPMILSNSYHEDLHPEAHNSDQMHPFVAAHHDGKLHLLVLDRMTPEFRADLVGIRHAIRDAAPPGPEPFEPHILNELIEGFLEPSDYSRLFARLITQEYQFEKMSPGDFIPEFYEKLQAHFPESHPRRQLILEEMRKASPEMIEWKRGLLALLGRFDLLDPGPKVPRLMRNADLFLPLALSLPWLSSNANGIAFNLGLLAVLGALSVESDLKDLPSIYEPSKTGKPYWIKDETWVPEGIPMLRLVSPSVEGILGAVQEHLKKLLPTSVIFHCERNPLSTRDREELKSGIPRLLGQISSRDKLIVTVVIYPKGAGKAAFVFERSGDGRVTEKSTMVRMPDISYPRISLSRGSAEPEGIPTVKSLVEIEKILGEVLAAETPKVRFAGSGWRSLHDPIRLAEKLTAAPLERNKDLILLLEAMGLQIRFYWENERGQDKISWKAEPLGKSPVVTDRYRVPAFSSPEIRVSTPAPLPTTSSHDSLAVTETKGIHIISCKSFSEVVTAFCQLLNPQEGEERVLTPAIEMIRGRLDKPELDFLLKELQRFSLGENQKITLLWHERPKGRLKFFREDGQMMAELYVYGKQLRTFEVGPDSVGNLKAVERIK